MEFDKSKVYTALNAEELEVGSEVMLADNLESLKQQVEANSWPTRVKRLDWIMGASFGNRFNSGGLKYNLAYLVRKVAKEEEQWIVYLAREQDFSYHLEYCAESFWAWGCAKPKLFVGTHDEAKEWCQSRQKFAKFIKAFEDGKTIQVRVSDTDEWSDCVVTPEWSYECEYRVKPDEDLYVVYVDHYSEPHLDFGSYAQWDKIQEYKGAKNKLFVGSKEECRAWCDSHDKFADVIFAWENGKEIQFYSLMGRRWETLNNPSWNIDYKYRVKPNGLVWTDLKMGDILWMSGRRPVPLGGKYEYEHFEERRIVTRIVDDSGTKRHVQLGGDWINDEDLEKWSVEK